MKFSLSISGISSSIAASIALQSTQKALQKFEQYDVTAVNVTLVREDDNTHDTNAIRVDVSVGSGAAYQLGYIPKDVATVLAPLLDKGIELLARFKGVTGGTFDKLNYDALITVEM